MTIEQLRAAHRAQPFRPFVMHLADGREIPVKHLDLIMTAPSVRTVIVYQEEFAAISGCAAFVGAVTADGFVVQHF